MNLPLILALVWATFRTTATVELAEVGSAVSVLTSE